ncbi:ABC transporter ATP-binding protein [Haloplanus halophilus]|uniref:ABC transporter ATP-binding protein n=1 Tax=Haloplanus halophilus TaxID=2949993 RepID=UPI002041F9A7|nr:ABC transporter ATP-binding protein [Haloplanus sp. GDY1]
MSNSTIHATEETTDRPLDENGTPVLELDDVSKSYGSERVIEELSLSVHDGEILTLLGPSGCGKTTTLRLIAGLERPNVGEVALDGTTVSGPDRFVDPESRGVGVVFQEFALFPHLTTAENVAFGIDDWDDGAREARIDELLDLVGLEAQRDSYPDELSGGQQQRVALARSLAPEPDVLLLDEPFSNLDVDLRVEMREEVRRIIKETGVTAVSVTHDQEEALSISDRVAVMNDGRIEQVGDPEQVFQQPTSRFVAGFLGHASFLPGYVHGGEVTTGLGPIPRDQINGLASTYDRTRIDVLVRPDDIRAVPTDGEGDGRVVSRRYLGPTILYEVRLDDDTTVQCMHNHDETIPLDCSVRIELDADHDLAWFPSDQRPDDAAE